MHTFTAFVLVSHEVGMYEKTFKTGKTVQHY